MLYRNPKRHPFKDFSNHSFTNNKKASLFKLLSLSSTFSFLFSLKLFLLFYSFFFSFRFLNSFKTIDWTAALSTYEKENENKKNWITSNKLPDWSHVNEQSDFEQLLAPGTFQSRMTTHLPEVALLGLDSPKEILK